LSNIHQNLHIPTVILAGGQGNRLGGLDKCLLKIGDTTILNRIINSLNQQQCSAVLNANGEPQRFASYPLTVISDLENRDRGPLAGIISMMQHLDSIEEPSDWFLSVPGDSPFLPNSLLASVVDKVRPDTDIVYCKSGTRDHFVTALWSRRLYDALSAYLNDGARSVGKFIFQHNYQCAVFNTGTIDPFFNINTAEQLAQANHYASSKT